MINPQLSIVEFNGVTKRYVTSEAPAVNEATFSIQRACITALLGGSGSGKSTVLRLLAGLETPEAGSIVLAGNTVSDGRTFVPPEKRNIGLVFQDYALFPHLTVKQNIEFGLGKKSKQDGQRARSMLELVELDQLGHRYPHELSGGQRQRVAIARALAPQPDILLLDEPFSNLDDALKAHVRRDLTRIIRTAEMTAVFVTHDVRDVFAAADRLIVLDDGHVRQAGRPDEVYQQPANPGVARIFGETTIIKAQSHGNMAHTAFGEIDLGVPEIPSNMLICLRPGDLQIAAQTESGLQAVVECTTFFGMYNELLLRLTPADSTTEPVHLTLPLSCDESYSPGARLTLTRAVRRIHFWPAD